MIAGLIAVGFAAAAVSVVSGAWKLPNATLEGREAFKRDDSAPDATFVLSLDTLRSPAAVAGFVALRVVDAVELKLVGTIPHVGEEVGEDKPAFTDCDPRTAVARVAPVSNVEAASFHGRPSAVCEGLRERDIGVVAPFGARQATHSGAASQLSPATKSSVATGTLADPPRTILSRSLSNYGESAEGTADHSLCFDGGCALAPVNLFGEASARLGAATQQRGAEDGPQGLGAAGANAEPFCVWSTGGVVALDDCQPAKLISHFNVSPRPSRFHAVESAASHAWVSTIQVAAQTLVGQSHNTMERLVIYRTS